MANATISQAASTARVLVFAVDDGCFCIHLDWVEAVYQREDAPLHTVKDGQASGRFLIHGGQPALLIDLREAFGLSELLGPTERAAFMVVRAGSFLLALQVDACIGVRDLDLHTKSPVPTALLRDGGLSVGHMVELAGKPHGLLEPSRILNGPLRDRLEPLLREAQAFRDRHDKLAALTTELRREPTPSALKIYTKLSRRNGRARAAASARVVLKAIQEATAVTDTATLAGDLGADTLVRDLVALSGARQTGELHLQVASGRATMFFDAGRIADAFVAGEWGRGAFKHLLATREGTYRFASSDTPVHPQRISDAALWLLVETIEHVNEERRGRHR